MKLLLAVDGSPFSIKAARYIATHFDVFGVGTELHLLAVKLPIPAGLALVQANRILGNEAIDNYYRDEARAMLAPSEKILHDAEIPFQSSYKVGPVAEQIIDTASTEKMDMIMIGSHGHGALANVLMGSVATRVLAAATVPVLIIR